MPLVHAKSSVNTLMNRVIIHYRPRPALRIMPFHRQSLPEAFRLGQRVLLERVDVLEAWQPPLLLGFLNLVSFRQSL